jgi:exodeoxyribonuclease VII large subunit
MHTEQPGRTRDIYTVTRLNREAKAVLEGSFPPIWVQGEISNLARPSSGHLYFSLKDKYSQVRCAMFKGRNQILKFNPENGVEVFAQASISLYEGRGEFQLIINQLEPAGVGALQLAFEQLKERLAQEGLFDPQHKRPLPVFPQQIGVITSSTGAAVRDILHVLKRRYPSADVIIYPVPVQGDGSAALIAAALEKANQRDECEVIILARGGGSLEDLWSFNEEKVARAIFNSRLPVITGIGHETDFTIADFVADQRAPTPSAAAELVSPDRNKLFEQAQARQGWLVNSMMRRLDRYRQTLAWCEKQLPNPVRRLQTISQRVDEMGLRSQRAINSRIELEVVRVSRLRAEIARFNPVQRLAHYHAKCMHLHEQLRNRIGYTLREAANRLGRSTHALQTVSPLSTLDRGYAIVSAPASGHIVKDINTVRPGDVVSTQLANGSFESQVTGVKKND